MSDLAKRLRTWVPPASRPNLITEAADHIDALEAENKSLKAEIKRQQNFFQSHVWVKIDEALEQPE